MFQQSYEKKLGFYNQAEKLSNEPPKIKSEPICNPNVNTSNIKISCLISPTPTEGLKKKFSKFRWMKFFYEKDELIFLVQMGVTHVFTWISNEQSNFQFLFDLRTKVESFGLILWNVGNRSLGKSPNTILALSDRDKDIAAFIEFIRTLAKAGIFKTSKKSTTIQ